MVDKFIKQTMEVFILIIFFPVKNKNEKKIHISNSQFVMEILL